MNNNELTRENEMTTETTTHLHELCTETHIGKGEWAKSHRWTEPHCVECGEAIPVPALWTERDIETWGTSLSELAK